MKWSNPVNVNVDDIEFRKKISFCFQFPLARLHLGDVPSRYQQCDRMVRKKIRPIFGKK